MKVKYLFVTTQAEEPYAIQNFIDAYELNGSIWDGTIDFQENVLTDDLTSNFINSLGEDGYELVLYNSYVPGSFMRYVFADAFTNYGLQAIFPVGSNSYHSYISDLDYVFTGVKCGSGDREFGNATAFPCTFFDKAISENYVNIHSIAQCGKPYKISHIRRASSTVLAVKLQGYSNLIGTGIYEHGIPINFGNLSGTDISPLPSGIKYTSYADEDANFFFISHDTTAGTINTGFNDNDYQVVTDGTIQYGGTNPSEIFIINESFNVDFAGSGVTIKGVTGFENNPEGTFGVSVRDDTDGYGNKVKINYSLGDGTYGGGGKYLFSTESYSTPHIAGLITDIKLSLGIDWTESIGRAVVTSSNYPNYDIYDGFGCINVNEAKNYIKINNLKTPVLSLNYVTSNTVNLIWNFIPFAVEYELWFKNSLYATITNNIIKFTYAQIYRSQKVPKNYFKVRAKKGNIYSDFSNQVEFPYYAGRYLKIK